VAGMGERRSERRLVENEQLARRINRRVEEQVTAIREADGGHVEDPIAFFCECSDIACQERFEATAQEYDRIHADPDQFVVMPGHVTPEIEAVVDHLRMCPIVRKTI
jgi:hypothetical protein